MSFTPRSRAVAPAFWTSFRAVPRETTRCAPAALPHSNEELNELRNKILSTLLALALALSLLPAGALAAEGDDEAAAASEITEETGSDPESGTGPENSRTSVFAGGTGTREDPMRSPPWKS